MIKGIFSLRNFVAKQLTKSNPEGIMKLPNKGQIDFGEMMIREELFLRGIDHKLIKNEKQLETILNTPIPTPHTPKSADVLDLTGKKIDTDKPIVGGKNIDWEAVEKTDIEDFVIKEGTEIIPSGAAERVNLLIKLKKSLPNSKQMFM